MESLKSKEVIVKIAYVGESPTTLVRVKAYGPKLEVKRDEVFDMEITRARELLDSYPYRFIAAEDLADYKKTVQSIDKEEAAAAKRDRISSLEANIAKVTADVEKMRETQRSEFIAKVPTMSNQACIDLVQNEHLDVEVEEGSHESLHDLQQAVKEDYLVKFDRETKTLLKEAIAGDQAELKTLTAKKGKKATDQDETDADDEEDESEEEDDSEDDEDEEDEIEPASEAEETEEAMTEPAKKPKKAAAAKRKK